MDKDPRQLELDLQMPREAHPNIEWSSGVLRGTYWYHNMNSSTPTTPIIQVFDWNRWTT